MPALTSTQDYQSALDTLDLLYAASAVTGASRNLDLGTFTLLGLSGSWKEPESKLPKPSIEEIQAAYSSLSQVQRNILHIQAALDRALHHMEDYVNSVSQVRQHDMREVFENLFKSGERTEEAPVAETEKTDGTLQQLENQILPFGTPYEN